MRVQLCFVLSQITCLTDRQTDWQTEFSSLDSVCISCSEVKTETEAKDAYHVSASYNFLFHFVFLEQCFCTAVFSSVTRLSSYTGHISSNPTINGRRRSAFNTVSGATQRLCRRCWRTTSQWLDWRQSSQILDTAKYYAYFSGFANATI